MGAFSTSYNGDHSAEAIPAADLLRRQILRIEPPYGRPAADRTLQTHDAIKEQSSNRGEVDYPALIAGRPQGLVSNPTGRFQLFRIGDAVSSRNIHAAIYDALRLCKDL